MEESNDLTAGDSRRPRSNLRLPARHHDDGCWDTARTIHRAHGWRGYFVGISIGYLNFIRINPVSFASWVPLKNTFGPEGV
ncbi:BZ3500_MvSof-1268-A1-R1_Chr3-1g05699 [Microbotryum saponariae]|uniref:BZ3500_MvSof-1268-A1-R1_Chr3-1g05699 protein n=1 Tax=Microbotryum saponariae TaxID=289078 RepID=A0A2X0LGB6_9BASI|nr:BZ3500_MvSof-1268-A1-R1_Chr3-1g05699 [Microbotryum saponariae]SDA04889.1 BZ3501_MvSof-1269-A2-R1_Chr3-1g05369 [Microbotryum saponariae]